MYIYIYINVHTHISISIYIYNILYDIGDDTYYFLPDTSVQICRCRRQGSRGPRASPSLFEVIWAIGKEEVLGRLRRELRMG